MAGPFDVNPNSAPNISPIQLTGVANPIAGPQVDVGKIAADVANKGADLYIEQGKKKATADLTTQIRSVRDALQVANNPNLEETAFSAEAMKNPYFRQQLNDFKALKAAQRDGTLPQEFVVQRLEDIVSVATSRTPAFEAELKAAARDVLGFDPQHRMTALLMSDQGQKEQLSAFQQRARDLRISEDELAAMELSKMRNDVEQGQYSLAATKGKYNANMAASDARLATSQATVNVATIIQQQIAQGGVEDVQGMMNLSDQAFDAEILKYQQNATGNVDPGVINGHISTLEAAKQRSREQIENGSTLKNMQQYNALYTETAKSAMLQMPVLGKMYALFPNAAPELFQDLTRWVQNPGLATVSFANGEGADLNLALRLELIEDGMELVSQKRAPSNDKERRVMEWLTGKKLQAPGQTGGDVAETLQLVEQSLGNDVSIVNLSNQAIAANVAKYKEAHPHALATLAAAKTSAITEWQQLAAQHPNAVKDFALEGRTLVHRPTFTPGDNISLQAAGGDIRVQPAAVTSWIKRFNRLVRAYDNMQIGGVVTESLYRNPAELFEGIKTFGSTTAAQHDKPAAAVPQSAPLRFNPATGTFEEVK